MAEMKFDGKNIKVMILIAILLIGGGIGGWKYLFPKEEKVDTTNFVSREQLIINKALGTKVNKLDASFFDSEKYKDLNPDRFTIKDLKSLKIGNGQPFDISNMAIEKGTRTAP